MNKKKILLYLGAIIYFFSILVGRILYNFPFDSLKDFIQYKCSYPPFFYLRLQNVSLYKLSSIRCSGVTLDYNLRRDNGRKSSMHLYMGSVIATPLILKSILNGPSLSLKVIKDRKTVISGSLSIGGITSIPYIHKAHIFLNGFHLPRILFPSGSIEGYLSGKVSISHLQGRGGGKEDILLDVRGVRLRSNIYAFRSINGEFSTKAHLILEGSQRLFLEKVEMNSVYGKKGVVLKGRIILCHPLYTSRLYLTGELRQGHESISFSLTGKARALTWKIL